MVDFSITRKSERERGERGNRSINRTGFARTLDFTAKIIRALSDASISTPIKLVPFELPLRTKTERASERVREQERGILSSLSLSVSPCLLVFHYQYVGVSPSGWGGRAASKQPHLPRLLCELRHTGELAY